MDAKPSITRIIESVLYIYIFNKLTVFNYIILQIKRDEVDKKIFEVAPDDTLNTEIFPQFIPKNMRYKCSIAYCTYMGTTEDMLKKHISTIHPTHEYYM